MTFPLQLFWLRFKRTPGAISCAEACAISDLASQVPDGTFIDIGSHAGKSSMAAAHSLPKGKLYMVDPVFDLDNLEAWEHSVQGHPNNHGWDYVNHSDFNFKVSENIRIVSAMEVEAVLVGDYSENAIQKFDNISWAFIDSDTHQGGMVMREAKLLEDKMVKGGIIAFHDWGNQFQEPREAGEYLISTGKYELVTIDWAEIFNFIREHNHEQDNNSWHEKGSNEFPRYVGAVKKI